MSILQHDAPLSDGVTVVIPFYNRSSFARRLLDSILGQAFMPSEILFVDNGSTYEEVQALQQIIASVDIESVPVRYIASRRIGNANIARNLGMLGARNRYVAFLDSDDWWDSKHLQISLKTLQKSEKTGVYGGSIVHSKVAYTNYSANLDSLSTPFHLLFSREGWLAQTSTYVIDKTRLCGVTWDERLRRHQDYDFFLSVALNGNGWVFNSEPTSNLERNDAGGGRYFDFKSMIRFLEKWRNCFPQECMQVYLLSQLDACIISKSSRRYYDYYRSLYLSLDARSMAPWLKSLRMFRAGRVRLIDLSKRLRIYSLLKKNWR